MLNYNVIKGTFVHSNITERIPQNDNDYLTFLFQTCPMEKEGFINVHLVARKYSPSFVFANLAKKSVFDSITYFIPNRHA